VQRRDGYDSEEDDTNIREGKELENHEGRSVGSKKNANESRCCTKSKGLAQEK
jgi:hypothetical protein